MDSNAAVMQRAVQPARLQPLHREGRHARRERPPRVLADVRLELLLLRRGHDRQQRAGVAASDAQRVVRKVCEGRERGLPAGGDRKRNVRGLNRRGAVRNRAAQLEAQEADRVVELLEGLRGGGRGKEERKGHNIIIVGCCCPVSLLCQATSLLPPGGKQLPGPNTSTNWRHGRSRRTKDRSLAERRVYEIPAPSPAVAASMARVARRRSVTARGCNHLTPLEMSKCCAHEDSITHKRTRKADLAPQLN